MTEQLKEGYKKTEVGIIPNEWTPKTYGELFHFLTTSSFSRDELSEEGEVRCVHYGDIHTKYRQFLDFSNGFNSFIDLERGKKYPFVKDGDIIMADASEDYSGIGKSVEVKNLGDKLAISGLHTFLLRDKNGDFVDGFRAYIHCMTPVKKSMDRLATGLKVYGVSKANVKTVLVPVPPPAEQQAIATALSDIDTLITNLDKLIAKKKAIKQGAMQRLLKSPAQGGQRLPGFEGEWRETNMGSVIDLLTGYPFSSSNYQEFGIRLLRGSNIKRGNTDWDDSITQYWPEITPELKKFELKEGDIVIAMDGSLVGRSFAQLASSDLPALLLQRVARIRSNSVDLNFLKELVCSDLFTKYCDTVKTVTAIPHISPDDIRNYPISLPPSKEEQKAIASILSDMKKEIDSLETKKSKYLRIKQGMMQELLTGKTRLV